MPQPFNNAVMTNAGARLLTRAQAGEIKIEFTRIAVGNGNYTAAEKTLDALQKRTALKSLKNSYTLSDVDVFSDYSVKVTALITNQDPVTGQTLVNAGYYINEMGLFAKVKDGAASTEVLYSITTTAGDNGDFMPPYNGYNPAQITQDYFANLQPTYNNTTAQEKTAITNFSSRAAFLGGPIVETITDLLIMFAKTTNLQEAYGYGNCSGYDASQSPTYGVKRNAVVGGGQFYGTDDKLSLNKIFHSIVLGSYQQWMRDPYEVVVNGRVKVSKNYTYDPTGAAYTDTGITVPDNKTWDTNHNAMDYPAHFRTVPGYGSIPALGMDGGSSATGGCDGLWRKDPKQTFTGVCLRFGYCNHGLRCGLRARDWDYSAAFADWVLGAADLLLPPVGVAV